MKYVSPIEAVGLVKSGDTIVVQGSTYDENGKTSLESRSFFLY